MEQFQSVIKQMISLFDEHLPLEEKKLKAVTENDLVTLEDCMKQEQAVVLKLRGLEKKREDAQKANGWEGKRFREIIELVPEDQRAEFQRLFDDLDRSIALFRSTNSSAMDTMNVHLRQIGKVIKTKDPKGAYNQAGGTVKEDRPLTSRRV